MLGRHKGKYETNTFIEFIRLIENNPDTQRWLASTARIISRSHHTAERQKLLQYGAVIHALIDTLDSRHEVTRERPSYPNKLSKRSWRDLRYRVFGQYLRFVKSEKYLGPPKRGGPRKGRRREETLALDSKSENGTSVGPPLAR
jgi:hypothetical protein